MKTSNMKYKSQVYSVGNYLMTGKVLGKGHFARVEEATHRVIGKRVAIKVIDLTCIKEEYARRNLHREPRVMAKLRHPCIAALYETMMHGPRLYVVMEAAGGGDLCAHVLAARGPTRGLPEPRARHLAAQLVSAVKHMHSRGVVHRDLKMENIMLDSTKHYIKIVDFGLSNMWTSGGALRTPCGSLEYAAPELFVDGRRYGPEVDLWSVGVIVYGMVTGGLPFTGAESGEGRSRPQLRAAIAKGFTRKQRAALACVSNECKVFVQQLLEPNVNSRMKIDEASRHRWIRKQGLRMKTHPLQALESKSNNEICKQIADLCGETLIEVMAQIKADPFGAIAGMYNIKIHLHQLQSIAGTDPLWSANAQEPRPISPPEYRAKYESDKFGTPPCTSKLNQSSTLSIQISPSINGINKTEPSKQRNPSFNGTPKPQLQNGPKLNGVYRSSAFNTLKTMPPQLPSQVIAKPLAAIQGTRTPIPPPKVKDCKPVHDQTSPRLSLIKRSYLKKPMYKVYDNGDCGPDPRLPSINEHSNTDLNDTKTNRYRSIRTSTREVNMEDERTLRLNSCPNKMGDGKPSDFYRRAGDGFPCWRNGIVNPNPPRILFQNNATNIKRASLGNIVSPHSSSNSQCKSERAMPIGWYVNRNKDTPLQRFRRTTPMK